MIKIAITGPESSGKTTLAVKLAQHYSIPVVHEFARTYLENNSGIYKKEDLTEIAVGQNQQWLNHQNQPAIICDTEMLVIKIWSEVKFGSCDEEIKKLFNYQEMQHYFLCKPDIPWEYDPLRENPDNREELFLLYEHELIKNNLSYTTVSGQLSSRINSCIEVIDDIFNKYF